jgi:hypothetical protein
VKTLFGEIVRFRLRLILIFHDRWIYFHGLFLCYYWLTSSPIFPIDST